MSPFHPPPPSEDSVVKEFELINKSELPNFVHEDSLASDITKKLKKEK